MPSAGTQEFPAEYVYSTTSAVNPANSILSHVYIYNDNLVYYSKDRFLRVTYEKSSEKIFVKKYANDAISFQKEKEMADVCFFFSRC